MAKDTLNLSGGWKGIFNYPRSLPANQFDAELRDHQGVLTGETFERGNSPHDEGRSLHAMIEGHRHGFNVSFVKRYDEFRRSATPVHYTGNVSADGSEISGTWDIPNQWSGTFLMIRAKPNAAHTEQKVAEVVRS